MVQSTKVLTYGLSMNDKKNGFLRLIVFTIVKITSTDKEIVKITSTNKEIGWGLSNTGVQATDTKSNVISRFL